MDNPLVEDFFSDVTPIEDIETFIVEHTRDRLLQTSVVSGMLILNRINLTCSGIPLENLDPRLIKIIEILESRFENGFREFPEKNIKKEQ